MPADPLLVLLQRIEHQAGSGTTWNVFELTKMTKNVEYAQRLLLQRESDETGHYPAHDQIREQIRGIQAVLANKLDAYEQTIILESDDEIEQPASAEEIHGESLTTQEHILQNHRETQQTISDDLLTMAQTLRKSQEAFGQAIGADNDLIDKTGEALNRNADKMKNTGGRLSQYTRKSSWSWMYTYLAILIAFVSFLVTIGLIRIT